MACSGAGLSDCGVGWAEGSREGEVSADGLSTAGLSLCCWSEPLGPALCRLSPALKKYTLSPTTTTANSVNRMRPQLGFGFLFFLLV